MKSGDTVMSLFKRSDTAMATRVLLDRDYRISITNIRITMRKKIEE